MAILKPFKGVRPPKSLVAQLASRPYDVLSSAEARKEAEGNPYSLYHIIKSEIDLPVGFDEHAPEVYAKAVSNYAAYKANNWLAKDEQECLYIYAQTMNGRTQYGLTGCAGVDDYLDGTIKKHELTRKDKEEDRMIHVRNTNANMEPVFYSYKATPSIDDAIADFTAKNTAEYDFDAGDGVRHQFWVIADSKLISFLVDEFAKIPCTYVADGHHRSAAAALVGAEKRKQNANHTGKEEYNFFLAVHFPDTQLAIIDYNRLAKNLNGLTEDEFLAQLSTKFDFGYVGTQIFKPTQLHHFGMYLSGKWYQLIAKPGNYNDLDPIGVLDVTVLSQTILDPMLGITDLRTSKNIDFVGGIRGLAELQSRVDSGEMKVAFALYPVSMKQLTDIADSGQIMPPKTTWFEPKLRSGIVIHDLD